MARVAARRPVQALPVGRTAVRNLRPSGVSRRPRRAPFTLQEVKDRVEVFLYETFANQSKQFNLLFGLTVVLAIFGLTMVLSSSAVESAKNGEWVMARFARQAAATALGVAFMLVLMRLRTATIFRYAQHFFAFTLFLQSLTLVPGLGAGAGGNNSWIRFAGLSFQPAELVKLSLIILLARQIVERSDRHRSGIMGVTFGPALAALGLIGIGQDIGTAGIVFLIILGMVWLAGIPWEELKKPLLAAVAIGGVVLMMSATRIPRILYWLNPAGDTAGIYTWQPTHGLWGLAGGSIFGVGLGNSKIKWSWLPEAENDFIFSIIGEELGLIGALALVLAFLVLASILMQINQRTADRRSQLVVAGVFIYLVFQAMVNIAIVVGYGPVLGVPLPLISAGGSSIISSLGAIGVVLAIERENNAGAFRAPTARKGAR